MTSQWLADSKGGVSGNVREVVRESWARAEKSQLDPDRLIAPLLFESSELREYRDAHPLASMMPVIRKLLVRDADDDSGMLVAVGDANGRLLWVEGDQELKSKAESMMFVEGSDWSEAVAGTSAPGTALAVDHSIQIRRDEHYNRLVHAWSCTAVPVHDPETRAIIGVIDITGGEQAVDRHTMPLMEATAHAVETEMMMQRMQTRNGLGEAEPASSKFVLFNTRPAASKTKTRATLQILGRDSAQLSYEGSTIELTARHSEIITLLAFNRSGLSADRLAELLWGEEGTPSRLRPEMVRLRKLLASLSPNLTPESKPYRISESIEVDAQHVVSLLNRGAHRAALAAFKGELLPSSIAPGVEALREEISSHLRESILSDASVEVLLEYADTDLAVEDTEVWYQLLKLLPSKSPKRARVVAHVESLTSS